MIHVLIPTTKNRRERLAKCVEAIRESVCTEPITISTYENADGGFIKAIHKMLEPLKDNAIVFCIGDDVIVSPDAIQKLFLEYRGKSLANTSPDLDPVIQPFDEFHNGVICVNPFTSARMMKLFQYKGYIHNYADVEFTELVKSHEQYTYVPEATVEHVHRINGKAPSDETYEKCGQFMDHDRELFIKRKAAGFMPRNP